MIAMIGKVLGLGKKSDYFLEFDESKSAEPAPTEPVKKPEPAPVAVEAPKAEAKVEAVEPKKEKAAKPAKAKKAAKAKAEKAAAPVAKTVAPAPVKEPAPINSGVVKTPAGMTFASDYLMPKMNGSRRRPGPSMTMFKDMARQVGRG